MAVFKNSLSLKNKVMLAVLMVFMVALILSILITRYLIEDMAYESLRESGALLVNNADNTLKNTLDYWDQGLIDIEKFKTDAHGEYFGSIPVISAMNMLRRNAQDMEMEVKIPKISPRNPDNEPDALERNILEMFKREDTDSVHIVEDEQVMRVFKPIRLEEMCLICHGNPANSMSLWGRSDGTDPTGGRMEGWNAGEIHGAYEIIINKSETKKYINEASLWITAGFVLIFLPGIIGIVLLLRRLLAPIKDLIATIKQMAKGNLDAHLTIKRRDEIGEIAVAYNDFIKKLRSIVSKIIHSVEEFTAASMQISSGNQDLSQRTSAQAASLEETSSTMETITHMIQEGNDKTQEINKQANEVSNTMDEINDSTNKMSDIIKVIDDIAFQTNLLALNASIEAARAGEAGKGFEVVAVEVRNLSQKTTASAREIVMLINESNSRVEKGVNKVKQITNNINEMTETANQQLKAIDEINVAISELDSVTQQNASLVEEAAAASENISAQAQELSNFVQFFHISEERKADAPNDKITLA